MAYVPLTTAPTTPARVQRFLTRKVDHHVFIPLHELLLSTNRHYDTTGLIATMLVNVISGTSVLVKPKPTNAEAGKKFKDLLERYYPFADEKLAIKPEKAATLVYKHFRNPLAHSLGIGESGEQLKIVRGVFPTEGDLEAFERASERPSLKPTIEEMAGGGVRLRLKPLYWGVRRMIERCTADTAAMAEADQYLAGKMHW